MFFDLLIPKVKPISIGIFYRPPNVNTFLETFLNDLKLIDFIKSEVYFLGDFNINLLQNNKFVLKENQPLDSKNLNSPLLPKYKELCQTFSLKEIIQVPTRVTSSTSSLLDHILTNSGWKVSQKGVIDVGLSDHQLIYCTRKIVRAKTNVHNQIRVRSLKNYTQEILLDELRKINFSDYSIFSNVNIAYKDLVEKILNVVDKIAPFKVLRVKNNTQEWFDSEVAEAIDLRDKRLKHFKSTKLHVDEELYKEAKYQAQKLIKEKKKQFYKEKLKEDIGKPKDLWKTLKGSNISNICLKKDDKINFDEKTNANTFKEFYCNLAGDLLNKLPPPSNKFGITSVRNFYQTILDQLPFKFKFSNVTEDLVFKLLNDMNPDKAAGIDNLSGKFLKDGASILAKPISKICNLSIKYSLFPTDCQIARLRFLYRQNKFLDIPLRRLLCNAMIQPFFDYACNAWYPNLNKKLKKRLQAAQNKCIRFCLKLGDRTSIKTIEFEKINWLPIQERVNQCTLSSIYKFHSNIAPEYMDEVFFKVECNRIPTRYSYQKLKLPHRKTNQGLRALSYIGPFLWNKLSNSLKMSASLNTFKHNLKNQYFRINNN